MALRHGLTIPSSVRTCRAEHIGRRYSHMFPRFITLPFLAHDPKAIEIVQVVLESVVLRREKNMRDTDGKPIVELPTKQVHLNL